ncbi:DUF6887 family protein [Gloeobacter kilaueensis]|uniref:Uncharacterized protein n=1 Tax=Gloeobacter kilaueensis (strain ATCC BAA-2537 / CCAP 1431/1 / ULC 316 / JS1) TaxID=1183438 RepID=U5QQT7_GLOK1|nr:hypothetical protein [Gloeobacter kilaueensis]AGY60065.1 hypothetical protein GKIL_3819 [Gloeobacter kilaueensis JS1]
MNRPDFSAMTLAELKAHMLAHREDAEAFYAYMDRSDAERPVLAIFESGEPLTQGALDRIRRERHKQSKS